MSLGLPVAIALWAGGITVGLIFAVGLGGEIAGRIRSGEWRRGPVSPGTLFGSLIVLAVPGAFAFPLAVLGFAALSWIGAPPLAFLFVALAGLVSLRAALNAPGGGMEGCSKMIGIFTALYVGIWGLVAFWFVGGPDRLAGDAASLAWLKPPVAALPLAVAITILVGKKRTRWTFPSVGLVLSAIAALLFFPVEAGLADRWLPAGDWLRFPLAGFAAGLVLASPWLLHLARLKGHNRKSALRDLPLKAAVMTVPLALTGLAWAAARAGIGLL